MSDSFKILSHFLQNLDRTLKILSNRKNLSIKSTIESNVKKCSLLNTKSLPGGANLLKPENATKQLENIQLVLFCVRKYVDYLIKIKTPNSPRELARNVENIQSTITTKSKELLDQNLDKNLMDLAKQIPLPIGRELSEKTHREEVNLNDFRDLKRDDSHRERVGELRLDKLRRSDSPDDQVRKNFKDDFKTQPPKQTKSQNFKFSEQKLSERSKATRVPATRLGRIASYGELVAGLGLGTFVELSKRQFGLAEVTGSSAFFNEANANRIVKTLCKVRGAALKIGQILSIQDLISPELARIFERVRQSADYMPEYQLRKVLNNELGNDWQSEFKEFDMKPFAAASIGQVHKAILNDGREVALKIQYPGVAEGIESDIKNLLTVLKVWNVLPPGLFIDSLIKVTKKELSWELDYEREIEMSKQYNQLVSKYLRHENFKVPEVVDNLCTKRVITSELVYGIPVDKLDPAEFDQETRNDVSRRLLILLLHEIFIFKFMQTDPNWSNFFYNPNDNQISLIDFGAARSFSPDFISKYYKILRAAAHKNRDEILKHSINIGFLTGHENKQMIQAHVDSVLILGKVFEYDDVFDFGEQDISKRIHTVVPVMIEHRLLPPPLEIYSLHRKLSGVFMLLVKLKAKVNCRELFDEVSEEYERNG